MVSRTIKARFRNGVIEPPEEVGIKEGEDAFRDSRGGWKGLIDCEELKRNIYKDRLVHTRPEVKL